MIFVLEGRGGLADQVQVIMKSRLMNNSTKRREVGGSGLHGKVREDV